MPVVPLPITCHSEKMEVQHVARNTDLHLRNQMIYSVFVRNYSSEGSFEKVREDLPRIRSLGADIIWLMPIHPIGKSNRKGSMGSPYAIRDYRAINPEYGTLEDFQALVDSIHALGMKVIIDVVYNHTSPDSWLRENHPEWFYHKPDGSFGNHVGEWTDIIDLDYNQRGLWEYQIETLKMWAKTVDGFRCDVAPLVPLDFWREAREQVEAIRPGCLWLAESIEPGFVRFIRSMGLTAASDSEIFQVFDMAYDYDIYGKYLNACIGKGTLEAFVEALDGQEGIYPENYVKMRTLENHDRLRAAALIPNGRALRNWTAFAFFAKGIPMVYNGQENGCVCRPNLFDRDTIPWGEGQDLTALIQRMCAIRGDALFTDSSFSANTIGKTVIASHQHGQQRMIGFFCTDGKGSVVPCDLPDGDYVNLLADGIVRVDEGLLPLSGEPVIIKLGRN